MYSKNIILKASVHDSGKLQGFVEECLAAGVELIATWGASASELEDHIDEMVVGDGSVEDRFIATTALDTFDDAQEFASMFNGPRVPQVVEL